MMASIRTKTRHGRKGSAPFSAGSGWPTTCFASSCSSSCVQCARLCDAQGTPESEYPSDGLLPRGDGLVPLHCSESPPAGKCGGPYRPRQPRPFRSHSPVAFPTSEDYNGPFFKHRVSNVARSPAAPARGARVEENPDVQDDLRSRGQLGPLQPRDRARRPPRAANAVVGSHAYAAKMRQALQTDGGRAAGGIPRRRNSNKREFTTR
jgi:hypothetical protein